jgi:hypothetical protein
MFCNSTRNLSAYYLYLKLAKKLCFSCYLSCFLFNKAEQQGGPGSAWKRGRGREVAQTTYTDVSKCKKDKIKFKKRKTGTFTNVQKLNSTLLNSP